MTSNRVRKQALSSIDTSSSPGVDQGTTDIDSATLDDSLSDLPQENIFLFWPNIIGYVRIVLAIASLYYMPLHPRTCSGLYSVSCLLDALDGYAARFFEESTRFGAVLDMVTDRCTTACLLVFLSSAWPRWALLFQGLISLDLASHYIHMYATLIMGGSETSHKSVDRSRSWILNLYYTNKATNEAGSLSVESAKSFLFANPHSAAALEMARANKMDSFVPWLVAGISFPVMLIKQIINVVQLAKASLWLAQGDVEIRKKQGLPRRRKLK
ncbi:hypothetical protein EPUL_003846 [Erysiphe pulchra]|uniref:CDP-diacylglycerol--inositol 3-phosphatidyltransferase n=1 Tax=Erysiphe pulchra TaxID=225359 RepID=A0A2S4PRW7_9PEZI|nr:hypothetical protein EPUL_003846 [Erysiphe pulchra]